MKMSRNQNRKTDTTRMIFSNKICYSKKNLIIQQGLKIFCFNNHMKTIKESVLNKYEIIGKRKYCCSHNMEII